MTLFEKRKKFDLHKFINRMKNRFQRVRKFCRMHTLPVLVAVGIMVSVIFASYQNAYATGVEELFYYTYYDLISGLFAETGSQFGLKDDFIQRVIVCLVNRFGIIFARGWKIKQRLLHFRLK